MDARPDNLKHRVQSFFTCTRCGVCAIWEFLKIGDPSIVP